MIFKSFEINKINKKINQLILFYGKNEGLKNEALHILIKDESNIHNYEEKEILDNENNFIENILSKSLFEKEKLILTKKYSEQFNYQNLDKKFKLNSYENEIRSNIYNKMISRILIDLANLK